MNPLPDPILRELLDRVSDYDLPLVCRVSKPLREQCHDPNYWRHRLQDKSILRGIKSNPRLWYRRFRERSTPPLPESVRKWRGLNLTDRPALDRHRLDWLREAVETNEESIVKYLTDYRRIGGGSPIPLIVYQLARGNFRTLLDEYLKLAKLVGSRPQEEIFIDFPSINESIPVQFETDTTNYYFWVLLASLLGAIHARNYELVDDLLNYFSKITLLDGYGLALPVAVQSQDPELLLKVLRQDQDSLGNLITITWDELSLALEEAVKTRQPEMQSILIPYLLRLGDINEVKQLILNTLVASGTPEELASFLESEEISREGLIEAWSVADRALRPENNQLIESLFLRNPLGRMVAEGDLVGLQSAIESQPPIIVPEELLLLAIAYQQGEILEYLLRLYREYHLDFPMEAFSLALRGGDPRVPREILKIPRPIESHNARDIDLALRRGHLPTLEVLLEHSSEGFREEILRQAMEVALELDQPALLTWAQNQGEEIQFETLEKWISQEDQATGRESQTLNMILEYRATGREEEASEDLSSLLNQAIKSENLDAIRQLLPKVVMSYPLDSPVYSRDAIRLLLNEGLQENTNLFLIQLLEGPEYQDEIVEGLIGSMNPERRQRFREDVGETRPELIDQLDQILQRRGILL